MSLLVNHPVPYDDESLASYVERLARANHYDPPRLFSVWLCVSSSGHLWDATTAIRQPAYYRRLSEATGQTAARLFTLSIHHLAPILTPPGAWLDDLTLDGQTFSLFPLRSSRLLLRYHAAAFCPTCLQEALYHRRHWQVAAVAACPSHGTWLLDYCPTCAYPLTIEAVTGGCCAHCQTDLREHRGLPDLPTESTLQAQQCLSAWLNHRPSPSSLGLPDASARVLFRVLDGLRIAVQLGNREQSLTDVRRRLSPPLAGSLYGAAFQGLKAWPEGFFSFLDTFQNPASASSGLKRLETLYSTWLEIHWRHPAFAFVQEAFNRYLTSRFPPVRSILQSKRLKRHPELVEQFAYIDVRNAARLTRTSPPKIARLIRDGLLDVYPERDPLRPGVFLYRSQVEAFVVESPPVPLRKTDAADYLGLDTPMLRDLLDYGLLIATGQNTSRGTALTYADLDGLCARLHPWVKARQMPAEGGFPLGHAAILNGKVGLGLADLLERILAGKLTAFHPSPDLRPLRDLWFEEAAISSLTQQVKAEKGWVSFLETAALLDIGRRVLHHWMAGGLLVPVASFARAQYFERSAVMDLRDRCITTPEVVRILQVNRGALSQWVRAGFLSVLSGPGINTHSEYVFDRQLVEAWHRTYVTTPEAKQMLNATDSMLRRWRQYGKLTRMVPDQKMHGFYRRDEVLALHKLLCDTPPAQKL